MIPLWPDPDPPLPPPGPARERRWPHCEEPGCGRRIWSDAALRAGPDGRRRGEKCRRAYDRDHRRTKIRISYTAPGDIPGQLEIQEET